ncbi:pyruvate kinase, partial [Streptococcus danieliae]|nr:pyruvate kinase [Streptococcus danieliae]
AIGMSVGYIAHNLDLHTIVTYTESGNTARLISKYRPNSLVLAVTPNEKVARGLSLVWGVEAKVSKQVETTDEMLETAATIAKESGYAKSGDEIIITGGIPVNKDASSVGTTNFLKVEVIR